VNRAGEVQFRVPPGSTIAWLVAALLYVVARGTS
jgi:hypothetical protein